MLFNIAGNAVKFTEAGSVSLRADLDELAEGWATVRLTVTDTGIGMDAETRERLFQPFAQASVSITRRFGGTGLGLSICRRIAELMGGEIGVDSEPGRGSSFWFRCTLERAAEAAPLAAAALDLPVARRDVVGAGEAEHVLEGLRPRDVLAGLADHHRELALVVHLVAGEEGRDQDRVAGILERVEALHEQHGLLGDLHLRLLGVVPVVQADAKDLDRRHRRQQLGHVGALAGDAVGAENVAVDAEGRARGLLGAVMDAPGGISVADEFHGENIQEDCMTATASISYCRVAGRQWVRVMRAG